MRLVMPPTKPQILRLCALTSRASQTGMSIQGTNMAKGEQRSNKMAKKPKKDTSPPKTFTSDRPMAPSTFVAPRGKVKDK